MNCRPLHLLPCGRLLSRASSCAAMASRRSQITSSNATDCGAAPLTCSEQARRWMGEAGTALIDGVRSGRAVHVFWPREPSVDDRQDSRGRPDCFGDSTKPAHRPTKILQPPDALSPALLHLCSIKPVHWQPFVAFQLSQLLSQPRTAAPPPHSQPAKCRPPSAR